MGSNLEITKEIENYINNHSLELNSKENNWEVFIPPLFYTTDNAAMIGIVGYLKYIKGMFSDYNTIASPRLAFK